MAEFRSSYAIAQKLHKRLINVVSHMRATEIALVKQDFKMPDLLTLFIDPAHHDVLQRAYTLSEPSGHTQELYYRVPIPAEWGGGEGYVRFHWHGLDHPKAFIMPYQTGSHLTRPAPVRPEAPAELKLRFEEVATDLLGVNYRFDQVDRTLRLLNNPEVCRSLPQVRYVWPCIVPLLRMAREPELADSVMSVNPKAAGAQLTPALRRMLAATNQTVATHLLIADTHDKPPEPSVPYEMFVNFKRTT